MPMKEELVIRYFLNKHPFMLSLEALGEKRKGMDGSLMQERLKKKGVIVGLSYIEIFLQLLFIGNIWVISIFYQVFQRLVCKL